MMNLKELRVLNNDKIILQWFDIKDYKLNLYFIGQKIKIENVMYSIFEIDNELSMNRVTIKVEKDK